MPAIISALLVQPLLAIAAILISRHILAISQLTSTLILSGAAGAILVALFAFMRSTVPIAPYALNDDAWTPIYGQTLLSLYIGFGLGANLAALIGVPVILYKTIRRAKKDRRN